MSLSSEAEDLFCSVVSAGVRDSRWPVAAAFRAQLDKRGREVATELERSGYFRRDSGYYVPATDRLVQCDCAPVKSLLPPVRDFFEALRDAYCEDTERRWTLEQFAPRLGVLWSVEEVGYVTQLVADLGVFQQLGPRDSSGRPNGFVIAETVLDLALDELTTPVALVKHEAMANVLGPRTIGLFRDELCREHVPLNLLREAYNSLDDGTNARRQIREWSTAPLRSLVEKAKIEAVAEEMAQAAHTPFSEALGLLHRLGAASPGLVIGVERTEGLPVTTAPVVLALCLSRLALLCSHRNQVRVCEEPQ